MDYIIKKTDYSTNGQFTIKPYTTNGPATPAQAVPLDEHAVSANTSLILLGKGMYDYGDIIASNFVHLLENFAGPNEPAYPIQGQLWYKNTTGELFLYHDGSFTNQSIMINGQLASNLNVNLQRIVNVGAPVDPTDATTKKYVDDNFVMLDGDTMSTGANLTFVGGEVLGLPAIPTTNTAAASKKYVDDKETAIQSWATGLFLPSVGGTLTGHLVLAADKQIYLPTPTGGFITNTEVVNKEYVDNVVSNNSYFLPLIGGTLSGTLVIDGTTASPGLSLINNATLSVDGNITIAGPGNIINVGNNIITNVGYPVVDSDAATKKYVDDLIALSSGQDGTLISGTMNSLTNTLTLVSSVSGSVDVTGIAGVQHTQYDTTIKRNINREPLHSRVRSQSRVLPTFPNTLSSDITNFIDTDLYYLMHRNDRLVVPVVAFPVVDVSTQTNGNLPIINIVSGVSGTITVAGDYTTTFVPDIIFTISNNTDSNMNGAWIVASSVFSAGNTIITIQGTIPGTAVNDGQIDQSYGAFIISNNYTTLIGPNIRFNISNNTGTGNGNYTTMDARYYSSSNHTIVYTTSSTPVLSGTTVTGLFQLYSMVCPFNFIVESNKVQVFINGIKQYKNTRGTSFILYNSPIGDITDTGLINGSYSFNIAVDGNPSTAISITVNQPLYTITAVDIANNQWSITGSHTSTFVPNLLFKVTGNTGGGNGMFTVVESHISGSDTVITVHETIPGISSNDGTIQQPFVFYNLVEAINIELATAGDNSIAILEDNNIIIYSKLDGATSEISITDVDLFNSMIDVPIIINGPVGMTLSYTEIGDPFSVSNTIDFVNLPDIGTTIEFINMR